MSADVSFNEPSIDSTQKAYALLKEAALAQVLRHFDINQDDIVSEADAARFVKEGQLALSRYKKYTESIVDDTSLRRVFATLDVFVQKYIYSTWAQDARHDILNTTGHDVVKSLDFRAILNDLVAITVADKLPEEKFIERVAILRGLDHTRVDQASQCLIGRRPPVIASQTDEIEAIYRNSRRQTERRELSAECSNQMDKIVRTPTRAEEGNLRYVIASRREEELGEALSVGELDIGYVPHSSASQNVIGEDSHPRMRIDEHSLLSANSRMHTKSNDCSEHHRTRQDDIPGGRPSHSSRKRKIRPPDDYESLKNVYISFPQCVRETWTIARLKSVYGGLRNSWPCAPFRVYSRAMQERMCSRCQDVNKVMFCVFHENSPTCIKCKVDKAKCCSTLPRTHDTVSDGDIRPHGQDNSEMASSVLPREKQLKPITVQPLKRLRRASAPPVGATEVISCNSTSLRPQLHESTVHTSDNARAIIVPPVTSPPLQANTQAMLEEVRKERLAITSCISMLFTQLDKLDDVAKVLSP